MLVIPAIDLKQGQCVRLRQGRMDEATIYSEQPALIAAQWFNEGAKRLHLVDLDGAFAGEPVNHQAIQEICAASGDIPVQIGGGIRSSAAIESYLDAGADFVIIGTAAVKNPDFVREACRLFPGHIIVGIDAKQGMVATEGWADVSSVKATELAKAFADAGVSAIVYTDIERDGMLQGANFSETAAVATAGQIPVIVSGGVTNMKDIETLCQYQEQGLLGAITGRAIYEGTLTLKEAQDYCDLQTGG